MKTSLLSVTFRKKTVEEIVDLAAQGGVDAIEWGSDVHVPPTDPENAKRAFNLCREKGLEVSAYGTYYRCDGADFAPYLQTAQILQTRVIRVWAGSLGSRECPEETRSAIVENLKKAVKMAEGTGCIIALEYHPYTLTDTLESTQALLRDVPGLYSYWQFVLDLSVEENLSHIEALGEAVQNIHAYYYEGKQQSSMASGEETWKRYLTKAQQCTQAGYVGLEFVRGGTAEQFLEDAAALRKIVESIGQYQDLLGY